MLSEISYRRFLEWKEHDKYDPIGGLRGDFQAASIVATLMNHMSAAAGSQKRWRPVDCLLQYGPDEGGDKPQVGPPRQSWQEQKAIGRMWALALNAANDKKPKKKWKR